MQVEMPPSTGITAPVTIVGFIAVHIWRVRKDGGIYLPPREETP